MIKIILFIILFLNYRDALGNESQYEVVSVIEFKGSLTATGQSEGHYICDVKERSNGQWFRTSTMMIPYQLKLKTSPDLRMLFCIKEFCLNQHENIFQIIYNFP